MRGMLFLVVGPSGAGKDTLITAARQQLEREGRHVFPRRVVTRRADPSEDCETVDRERFAALERAGAFALSWCAHGNAYGIPKAIERELTEGRHVVINVSRAIVGEARTRFAPARAILVTAPAPVLAERLAKRGRESKGAIEARLAREAAAQGDVTIVNDGAIEAAVGEFVAALDR